MAADPSTIQSALKETWTEQRIAEQLYNDNPVLSRVKRLKNTEMGEYALTPIHVGRNWGFSTTPSSGGTLNAAGNQSYAQAQWAYTNQHVQVKIQGSAIDQTKGDALSVASVVDEEVSGAVNDLNRNLSRQIFMDGSAQIAQCGTTSSSTTVQLNATSGYNAIERGWLDVGATIDIGTSSNPTSIANGVSITAVDLANSTITVSGSAVSTTSSAYVSLHGTRSGSTSYEMNGLGNIVSESATLGGIAPASTPAWKAADVDATSQAITLALLYTKNSEIAQKTGKAADFVVTGLKQQRKAYTLLQAQVRYTSESAKPTGFVDGVDINGVKLFAVPDCKNEEVYFLTIGDVFTVSAGDPYWQSRITGGETLAWVQGEDAYAGKITCRMQLGVRRRNSHAALTGLT
jgi:hypothetical protein